MHILTFTTLFPSERQPVHGTFIRNRMYHFVKKYGHQWTVVAPVPWFPKLPFKFKAQYDNYAQVPYVEQWENYTIYHPRYIVTPGFGMRWYGKSMAWGSLALLKKIHKKKPIDVIDAHYVYPDGSAAFSGAKHLEIPFILSARGTDLNCFSEFSDIVPMIKNALQAAKKIICVSEALASIAKECGAEDKKISVIGNGIDPTQFRFLSREDSRRQLQLDLNQKIILSVGHLIESKGQHLLIEAAARLIQLHDQNLLLVLVGEGPEREKLLTLAKSLKIADCVLLTGPIEQKKLPAWYAAADCFALMSIREGWPNVICEAQACGLPVVSSAVGAIPEIVDSSSLGILLASRSVEHLETALLEALSKNWDNQTIAKAGNTRTWDAVSDKLEPIFSSVTDIL